MSVRIEDLMARRQPGFSLEQSFYVDEGVFRTDMERVVRPQWLMVDHVSRIPNAGDYFLYKIGRDEIIVVRGQDLEVRAFYNVCRHRGSRICRAEEGNIRLLSCPYHAWSYDLKGALRSARLMPEDFDPSSYGLHRCNLQVAEGMIFINLSDNPPDFEAFIGPLRPYMKLHGIAEAKIAHRGAYPTDANWKLVLENFFECYHCQPAHKEYCQVHSPGYVLAYGGGRGSGPEEAEKAYQPEMDKFFERAKALGHPTGSWSEIGEQGMFRGCDRMPIKEGWLSETEDGTPAGPLMGQFNDWDGGYTSVFFGPFSTMLMTNDFATVFRFTPVSPLYTEVDLFWLVSPDATPGENLDVNKMIWMWDVTTIADKRIIEDNQAGVLSSRYQPGPYSRHEKGVEMLVNWYFDQLRTAA
ncbi:MAG: aromatic ring-hydroxylating dioxygenase subunit alpha [Rhodospirillales bacterium]